MHPLESSWCCLKICCSQVLSVSGNNCSQVPMCSCATFPSTYCFVNLNHIPHLGSGPAGLQQFSKKMFDDTPGLYVKLARVVARGYPANDFFSQGVTFLFFLSVLMTFQCCTDNSGTISLSNHDACTYFSLLLLQETFIRKSELYYLEVILHILNLRYKTGQLTVFVRLEYVQS